MFPSEHAVGKGKTPRLAVDTERRVPLCKVFRGDVVYASNFFTRSALVGIVPPVDAALNGFRVERVEPL